MKTIGLKLSVSLILASGLSACLTDTTIPEQNTSLNVDCKTEEIQIFDETIELSGEQSWIARCKGKTYTCSYFPESDAGCYELDE